jgi:hydrophobic/amphiphilic exporter-1 (mainly G- bacteria), HAE1 family
MVEKIGNALLPTLSVRRPVTVMMVLLCTLVLGLIAYTRIGLQILPSGAENPYLSLEARQTSQSSPYETESRITRPLEESLRTVPGITRISSRSRAWDTSISLRFDQRTDMHQAYAQIQDRVERTMPLLPESVRKVHINKFEENTDIPIVYFSFNSPAEKDDPYHFAESMIKRRLERIDGVAMVQFWGPQQKNIYIDLDLQKLSSLRLGVYELRNQLMKDNFSLSSGYTTEGGSRHLVRSLARFATLDDIRNLPVRTFDGRLLKLSDVARVSYRPTNDKFLLRRDGVSAIMMAVWKESMANTVDVSHRVEQILTEDLPQKAGLAGIDFKVYFNQGKHILEAIGNIEQTCLWGGLFAVLILLFFLRSWRMTGIITLAIPMSLMITVVVMYFTGWTLNLITMMGMMISIGMVVDNSIVVVENIFRLRQEGVDGFTAAIKGASEVSLAITLSTLTTIVVFLPLMLMGEDKMFTFYMIRIGLPVIVALVGSLLVALYFIPLGTVKMPPKKNRGERALIVWLKVRYQRMLLWCLAHRLDTSILLILLLASSTIPLGKLGESDFSEMERDEIGITIEPTFPI